MPCWVIALALASVPTMLLGKRARLMYGVTLFFVFGGLTTCLLLLMTRPNYHGTPGSALGLAILALSFFILAAGALIGTLFRLLAIGARQRWRRSVAATSPRRPARRTAHAGSE